MRDLSIRPRRLPVPMFALCGAALLASACLDGNEGPAQSADGAEAPLKRHRRPELTEFDVAENMSRFVFDEAPVFEGDGYPAYGNPFVTQGYIYPLGHLDDSPGTTPEGEPADPEAVLGEWTCRGVFVGDGAHTETGPWVVTTQLYDIYDEPGYEPGKSSLGDDFVSEGYEIADIGKPVTRAVTGGTGRYRAARGSLEQVFLGFNASEGVNLRVELDLD